MRVCSKCQLKTDESGRFCPECGGSLVLETQPRVKRTSASPAASLVGTTIDHQFALESVLGSGAFGTVYRGTQVGLDRPVAVKVPTYEIAADPVMAKRFAREARSAARVQHPGVVQIYAVGELPDGRPYLAMQLVDGEPLDKILTDGPLPARRALRIIRAIASALSETHAAEVVHRDLKPSNIIWRRDRNGDDRITLVDFGIAVCRPGNADATRLTSGGLIGTPHYMSPEQAHGEHVDARADLYALGCILYELVTGDPPFDGSGFEVLLAHLGRPAPAPSEKNADVPESIDRLCKQLLAKKPDERPASADALVALIDEALTDKSPPAARSRKTLRASAKLTRPELPPGTEPPRTRHRRRWGVGIAAAIVALAAAGFGVMHLSNPGGEPADTPDGPVDPHGANRREVTLDDGELLMRALVPDPIEHGHEVRPHIEIKNKLGQPVTASEVVVTVADATGAKGLSAKPHGDHAGHYTFSYTFPSPGHYVVRVFPPSVDSAFELPLDVR
ncbi:MAG: protein kinase [Deltaproteobacteria bacterium]|nr:protein kinase [Deltaproteobacteria bacterium]